MEDEQTDEQPTGDPALLGVMPSRPTLIRARATITTGGMQVGDIVQADPESNFVQMCFANGYLIPAPLGET